MATTYDGMKRLRVAMFSALAATAALASPRGAHAEDVQPTAKGIVGGAFLGGELVVFGEALFGVRSTAAYIVGAGAGAVAGGVGGYFVEQNVDDGRIPAYMLAGGLALLVPAIVVALDATRYLPTEGARQDTPVRNLPPADPGQRGGSSVVGAEPATPPATTPGPGSATQPTTTPAAPSPAPSPTPGGGGAPSPPSSLFQLRDGGVRFGVPVPEVRPVLGSADRARMGVENRGSELRFPVVRVTF